MNNDLIYTLDPVIIRIIFQVKTDDEALEIYNELANGVHTVYEETVKEYLLENSFNEEDVQIILNAVDYENLPAKYKPYVQNVILLKRIESNTKLFLKTYYDKLLPNLSAEAKKSLEDYIKESEEIIKERQEEVRAGLQLMKKILEDNGVKNYDELQEKLAKAPSNKGPEVSLGGIQTTSLPVAPEKPQEQQVTETNKPEVVLNPEPAPVVSDAIQPVIEAQPTVESKVEFEPEMPAVSEPTSTVAPENAPFDWNSLILEQVEANTEGGTSETVPATDTNTSNPPIVGEAPDAPIVAPIVAEAPVVESMPEQNELNAAALLDNLGISDNPPAMQSQPEQPVAPVGQPVNPQ